jgi:hypothetical protein
MITGVRWFAGTHCVGIVQIVQEHEKDTYRQSGEADFKYYIGVGWGEDEKTDMSYIAEHGTPFDKDAGNVLFNVMPSFPM